MTIAEAQELARTFDRMFYVHIPEENAVLQVYPGGRSIAWPERNIFLRRAHRDLDLVSQLIRRRNETPRTTA